MSTALWRSSLNCLRVDLPMPVLLFLPLGWDQPNPSTKSAGIGCGRRIHIRLHFFCADTPPWSRRLDSPWLPPKNIVQCSSFNCGRQPQGDWGSWWFLQIWGDGSWNFGFDAHLIYKTLILAQNMTLLQNVRNWSRLGVWVSPWTAESMVAYGTPSKWESLPCRFVCWISAAALLIDR